MDKKLIAKKLRTAVITLKYKRIIELDSDVASLLGYTKGTVSAYLSGKTEPSDEFVKKFENIFKLKLSDIKIEEKKYDESELNKFEEERPAYGFSEKLIDLLQKQQETINRSSITILEQAQTISQLLGNSSAPAVNAVH